MPRVDRPVTLAEIEAWLAMPAPLRRACLDMLEFGTPLEFIVRSVPKVYVAPVDTYSWLQDFTCKLIIQREAGNEHNE